MGERSSRPHGRPNRHTHPNRSGERVKDAQERLRLVRGTIFVYGDEDIWVAEDGSNPEESREEVGNDVERIVEVDGEEVLVTLRRGASEVPEGKKQKE